MTSIVILLISAIALIVLFLPRLSQHNLWRATITPLASIIGSGFLVLGPILNDGYGALAPMVMAALCLLAWAFGAAIRRNIATLDRLPDRPVLEHRIDVAADWALAFAYVISVAYYLNLFGAFAVNLTPFDSPVAAKVVTSAVLLAILAIGWTKGFSALERAEQISVSLKLAIIIGLLAGLAMFSAEVWSAQGPVISPTPLTGWPAVTLAFGLIVTVQGFETSRYLGQEYSAQTRIRSMRLAQVIATVIYLIYTVLLVYSMPPDPEALSETAIIDMMIVVAPILPPLLVAAALTAQFSAAVADTTGSGGLVAELTKGRVSARGGYLLLVLAGLALTWTADVFQIIAFASRAFALYYGLQAAIAAMTAWSDRRQGNAIALFFTALALLGFVIVAFGRSVE